jgi:serine/threonine-protein kinase SRPK3
MKIFELATNEPLFPLGSFGLTTEQIDKEHSFLIDKVLGKNGEMHERFTNHLKDRLPSDFGAENIQHLTSFLLSMLQRDPQKRKSTTELLNYPFLIREYRSGEA